MGSISLYISTTWYDLYPNRKELPVIQRTLDQHVKEPIDWQRVLDVDTPRSPSFEFDFREHGLMFSDALERLGGSDNCDIVPFNLDRSTLIASDPAAGVNRRLVSARRMVSAELNFSDEEMRFQDQATLYIQGDRSDAAIWGYCIKALLDTATLVVQWSVPGRVSFEY